MTSEERWLLDTCLVSELRRPRINSGVAEWVEEHSPSSCFLSVMTVLELESGLSAIERRDPKQATLLRIWLTHVVGVEFKRRTIVVSSEVALKAGRISFHAGISIADSLIAATALQHNLTVVTRNVRHFERTGVAVVNPWAE
ncbi:MAG: type II toxin-antitoxin system VapC family toxin [Microbacteriaceae bacterium]